MHSHFSVLLRDDLYSAVEPRLTRLDARHPDEHHDKDDHQQEVREAFPSRD